MERHALIAAKLLLLTLVLFGVVYPGLITGLAQLLYPIQANGSLISISGQTAGSALIGQSFAKPEYFQPRPSAAGSGYDASSSGGSNLGPTSQALYNRVTTEVIRLVNQNPSLESGSIPVDMVTSSASGLDPDITPANANAQIDRVAKARGISTEIIRKLVADNITGRQFGFLGESRVNVLSLNLALDRLSGEATVGK
ncbi:MAG: potassium-transporting ATPase subunit KdpC [Candidatus Margulisiibacteriota bacterium]